MHRKQCKRYNTPGDAHELTFSCFKRQPFLQSEWLCQVLALAVNKAKKKHSVHMWAWVFMPEHVHLLIYPTEIEYSISDYLQTIKQSVSRKVITYVKKENPVLLEKMQTCQRSRPYRFWMPGGGYDRNMESVTAIHHSLEYIHNNPVERGLVESVIDWRWSSAREWLMDSTGTIPVEREFYPH